MTDASVDDFLLRDDAESVPTDTEEVELSDGIVEVEAELAEDSLMTKMQDENPDEEFLLRRVLAKYTTPSFPTVEEDGKQMLDPECVDDLLTARVTELYKAFFRINGVSEEELELAEQKQKEALKGNLETNGGARIKREELS
jgi:hypothetical protein